MNYYRFLIALLASLSLSVNASAADFSIGDVSVDSDMTASGNMDADLGSFTGEMSDFGNDISGSTLDTSGSTEMGDFSLQGNSQDRNMENLQTEAKSDIEKYQDAFDQSRNIMQNGLPTIETESMYSLRTQLTDSMKTNASVTLKELMGDSFSGLDSSLFNISSMPSSEDFSMESLNVRYAEMVESFKTSSVEITGSLNACTSEKNGSSIADVNTELENWRNSDSYKAISEKISLADVFGSLDKQLPSKKNNTGAKTYSKNVLNQEKKVSSENKKVQNSIKKEQSKEISTGNSKLKSAAKSWAKNKKKNPVTGK